MKTIGRHLIAEFYGCNRRLLDDVDRIEQHMLAAAEIVGATVLGHSFHQFEPRGVSGTVVIAESHLSIHTWPQNGYVAVDIYTCGGLDPRPGCDFLARALECETRRVQEILRGIPEELEDEHLLLPDDVQVITRWVPATSPPSPPGKQGQTS
ncbi:MAG: adenosylmethionine decarboxylase [bacterium]|nr:adenosylmethionine decarboxylase [bacterium]